MNLMENSPCLCRHNAADGNSNKQFVELSSTNTLGMMVNDLIELIRIETMIVISRKRKRLIWADRSKIIKNSKLASRSLR